MFILKQYNNSKSGQLSKFTDLVEAFSIAFASSGRWELFFKVSEKPAKLLAYKEF